ncbi:hypothetical protein [Bremerella cremea]|uniref:hypothetical protein n=1 Tax=Bremerella cremea TaxID=1031537 RepID=UPI0031F0ADFC
MSLPESFRAFCLSRPAIADLVEDRIHQARAVGGLEIRFPFVVFFRRGQQHESELDQAEGEEPFRQSFDVECASLDLGQSQDLADALKTLHNYEGPLGAGTVQAIFIEDQDDDYQPRIAAEDAAVHVATLQVEIIGYSQPE